MFVWMAKRLDPTMDYSPNPRRRAGIQGLNTIVNEQAETIAAQKAELDALRSRLEAIEQLIATRGQPR